MAYQRKTVDCWRFYGNYGQGWEHECTEFTRDEMLENKRAYEQNSPGALKIVRGREKIADLPPGAYEDIQARIKAQREARYAKRLAKLNPNACESAAVAAN